MNIDNHYFYLILWINFREVCLISDNSCVSIYYTFDINVNNLNNPRYNADIFFYYFTFFFTYKYTELTHKSLLFVNVFILFLALGHV